jgi:acyl-CoA synthetase (AMP-forming)/AMP-acid ligase II
VYHVPASVGASPAARELRLHARETPDHVAVACGAQRLTYAELEALANRVANVFRTSGVRRGDHVATFVGNRPEALAIAWAAYRCGAYLTPIATSLAAPEVAYLIEDSDASVAICDAALRDAAAELPARVHRQVRWLGLSGAIDGHEPIERLLESASAAPHAEEPPGALMVYTSGTTGAPKGVIRPLPPGDYRGTPAFAADLHRLFDLDGRDRRYLSTAPLYHAAPLRCALAVTAGGGTVHVMDRFDAHHALQLLEVEGITHSNWVPAMFQRLLELPSEQRAALRAPAHRVAIVGAAPCPATLKQAMIDWWGLIVLEYYSGSEGVGLTLIDSLEAQSHPGSVGRARKGEIHVVDADGRELPPGTDGLICFSGVAPFAYYKAPEKTSGKTTREGWQTFGDIGHVDADGRLYLTDRQDDLIISGGVNVYPQEIERVIGAVTGVWECAVVGVPDERFGERPVAFVVLERAQRHAGAEVLCAVRDACERELGRFKRPRDIVEIERLPRTPTGKLLRRRLRERAGEAGA